MEILLVPPFVLLILALGAGRVAIATAPLATAAWAFHDKLFIGVDVSQPSALAILALTPWGLFAILSWMMVLSFAICMGLGIRNRAVTGFLTR
ncbi:hypothetical protein [Burkholderia cepacia]|uniref:hypothetical protein n=1 Tax=Burkholderia cepacia TaxID=292 RepID=UPI002AB63040|nr:hypothetical protein [Burkholderia cepacia]